MELMNRNGQIIFADPTALNFTGLLGKAIAQQISLENADFSNQVIENLTFEKISLSRVRLDQTQFKNVTFKHVIFEGCLVNEAKFDRTDFLNCHLTYSNLYRNQFSFCEIKNTTIKETCCFDNHFKQCLIYKSDLHAARFEGNFLECHAEIMAVRQTEFGLHQVKFIDTKANANHFKNILIKSCRFENSTLKSTKIDSAQIQNSQFLNTDFSHSSFCGCSVSKTKFQHQLVKDLRVYQSKFDNCKFSIEAMINLVILNSTYSKSHFNAIAEDGSPVVFEACSLDKSTFNYTRFFVARFTSCSLDNSDFRLSGLNGSILNNCTLYGTKVNLDQPIAMRGCQLVEALAGFGPRQEEPAHTTIVIPSDDEEEDAAMDED